MHFEISCTKNKTANNVRRGVQLDKYGILCFGKGIVIMRHMFMILQFYTKENIKEHITLYNKILVSNTCKVRIDIGYFWGADFKSGVRFSLSRQDFEIPYTGVVLTKAL